MVLFIKFLRKKASDILFNLVNTSQSLEDFRYYISLALILFFAVLPHVIFLFIFAYTGHTFLTLVNIISVLIYLLISRLLHHKKYTFVASCICLEVVLFVILSTLYFGVSPCYQWYIILVIPPYFLFLNAGKRQSIVTVCALYLCFVIISLFDQWFTPYYTGSLTFVLRILNLNIVSLGFIFELSLNLIVKNVVDGIYFKELEQFKLASWQDPLTSLYNRRYAEKYFQDLAAEKNESSPKTVTSLAMVDIDDFKNINDQYGHVAGDKVLQSLADLFKSGLRNTDLIIRWGGEEFLIILSGTSVEQACLVIDNLRQKIERLRLNIADTEIRYTITTGIAALTDMDVESSIHLADQNLYRGKQSGKNKVVAIGYNA